MHNVIIIGAGPAGISAALYVKRAGIDVTVIYSGESQLEKAHKIDNYYGFPDGISGTELYLNGIQQAEKLGIKVLKSEVTDIQMSASNGYTVFSDSGEYECSAVIIAVGNKKLRPEINGLVEFEGRGVSYCAVCDGFFYRGKDVCVIGNGRYAFEEALYLCNISQSVRIATNGCSDAEINELLKNENSDKINKISVDTRKIAEITGSKTVENLVFMDGQSVAVNGVFVALGSAGGADFAKKLGILLEGDSIKTDNEMKTNAPGIFSCGNVNGGLLQVCKAVYEGGVAGLSAVSYIRKLGDNKWTLL